MIPLTPLALLGRHVELQPLSREHCAALAGVAEAGDLWKSPLTTVAPPEEMQLYIETALKAQEAGTALPFVLVERRSGSIIGSTRFGNYEPQHRRVEIGWTWIAVAWQRTAVNTEAKYLLLRHAFEKLQCVRVEFKTDMLNERSRTAIKRLGAKEEGTLRQHMIMRNGRKRDTVYYSILDSEWPAVQSRLEGFLSMMNTL